MARHQSSAVFNSGLTVQFGLNQVSKSTKNTRYQGQDDPNIQIINIGIAEKSIAGHQGKKESSDKSFNGFVGRDSLKKFSAPKGFPNEISKGIIGPDQHKNPD